MIFDFMHRRTIPYSAVKIVFKENQNEKIVPTDADFLRKDCLLISAL